MLLIFVGCVGWRDGGPWLVLLVSDVSLVTVATHNGPGQARPLLTSSMINNDWSLELLFHLQSAVILILVVWLPPLPPLPPVRESY